MTKAKWMSVAAVVTFSTTLAFAGPGEGRGGKFAGEHGHGRAAFGARFAQKLNLTDAQKTQIRDLQSNFREQNKAFFESARETRQQFRAAREANDTARLEALKGTIASQREQMKALHEQQRARIVALLTPEQRTQFEALKAERQSKRGERGERGEGGKRHGHHRGRGTK
jgi:protein CpxP